MRHLTFGLLFIIIFTYIVTAYGQVYDTVYVDKSRPAGGSGQSWNSAFNDLDTALCQDTSKNLVILCAKGVDSNFISG